MEFTASSKAAMVTAAGMLMAGFAVIICSASGDNVAGSIGGACLVMVALTAVILVMVRHWIINTAEERRILAACQREAQGERARFIAAQAALENEMGRLTQDMAAERAAIRATLIQERRQMSAQFEEERAQLAAKAFQLGAQMERNGDLKKKPAPEQANLIPFPKQERQRAQDQPQHERSREHGVVGP
ncbi:hypothetical protein OG481_01855 [Streptomyces longwoodensis]|uniref:hypothetical protein n=1 Tax=Streptomyces longwoodensis TaxID=68231 RepID=UPI002DD9798D|nr:hypothetical protein [Streptomyces longwoodensis]WRY87336.1 hypothetical protein OG481_01855 [Streptomyces longwoodensis]